ncbi:MAG: hypothetical protein ACK4NC_07005 [Candidatus Gracilibacteria bacterium]
MLCIASFIVFLILGIFSTYYRNLAGKAWYCVGRRLTFKPCDINFSQEIKGKIIGKMILTRPRLAKFIGKWIDWIAFAFVIATIWSIISVMITGLNLLVYDTCDPAAPESCSLGGESCGISANQMDLSTAIKFGKVGEWAVQPFVTFADTLSRVPARFQTWKAEEYLSPSATYYHTFDASKKIAVEAIDPGCIFCQKLFRNIKEAGFEKKYNLSYIVYPIVDTTTESGYKFKHSPLIASYLEAVKQVSIPANARDVPADWQLLEYIFIGKDGKDTELQYQINNVFTETEVTAKLHEILKSIGYSDADIVDIQSRASSEEVKRTLASQRHIVEKEMKTIKIPTIIFDERRYDRVVDVEKLKQ